MHTWSKLNANRVFYGTGRTKGCFTYHYLPSGRTVSVFSVYTDDTMNVNYDYLTRQANTKDVEAFHGDLVSIPSFSGLQYRETGFPSVDIGNVSESDITVFKGAMLSSFGKYSERERTK